jgi:transposase-like protein
MMAERGLSIGHTTIMRRVYHYVREFKRRWNRFTRLGSVAEFLIGQLDPGSLG